MADEGDTAWLKPALARVASAALNTSSVAVSDLMPLPGHAGLGYSFVLTADGAAQRLVVRTIPDGTPAKGPADVVRQARIMMSMREAGAPTPQILWTGDEQSLMGRPFFVAEFVEGYQTPQDWRLLTERDQRLGRRAMEALSLIHRADWRSREDVFGERQDLTQEFDRLQKLFDRPTIDLREGGRLLALRDRLLQTLPGDAEIGCVHGDFHWGNIIFGEEEVRAIVDWEIAYIGPVLLDLGWIAFYADEGAFAGAAAERTRRFGLSPDEMIDCYARGAGRAPPADEVAWFRAFSAYRFGIISLFNCMLHRRGKRHDPMWEDMVLSVPQMMERGLELIAA
ncbi:MAG: phosphotransferase [Alphaproteobacteria bacterium]|nr:phosphotransferase [Alphaproteobacteria bacterium]